MAREVAQSLDSIIEGAVTRVMRETAQVIAQRIATMSADRLNAELATAKSVAKQTVQAKTATPKQVRRAGEIEKWVPDRRARRVPTFVIEMTGLDTKKKIVEKFGDTVVFRKGHAAPKAHAEK